MENVIRNQFGCPPHPGCFCKRVQKFLIPKQMTFFAMAKSPQSYEKNGFTTETGSAQRKPEGVLEFAPTPPGNADRCKNKGLSYQESGGQTRKENRKKRETTERH